MDNKKDISPKKKISFLQKIVGFTKNDENYLPDVRPTIQIPEKIEKPQKTTSGWKNIKA